MDNFFKYVNINIYRLDNKYGIDISLLHTNNKIINVNIHSDPNSSVPISCDPISNDDFNYMEQYNDWTYYIHDIGQDNINIIIHIITPKLEKLKIEKKFTQINHI